VTAGYCVVAHDLVDGTSRVVAEADNYEAAELLACALHRREHGRPVHLHALSREVRTLYVPRGAS